MHSALRALLALAITLVLTFGNVAAVGTDVFSFGIFRQCRTAKRRAFGESASSTRFAIRTALGRALRLTTMSTENRGGVQRSRGIIMIVAAVVTVIVIAMIMVMAAVVVITCSRGCGGRVAVATATARAIAAPGYDGEHCHQDTTQS